MFSTFGDSLVMAWHTVDSLTRLSEDELIYSFLAHSTVEAMRVIGILAGHDSLVQDGLTANVATVRAICTHGGAI